RSGRVALRRFDAGLVADVRVPAAEAQEGIDLRRIDVVRHDLAGEQKVVAGLAGLADLAPEDGDAAGDARRTARAGRRLERPDLQRRELVRALPGVAGALGDVLLRAVEERDAERAGPPDELAG